MSENIQSVVEDLKPKTKEERQKEYMKRYREKHGAYTEAQKKAIYKYNARIKEEAKKFREIQKNNAISVSIN